MAQRQVLDEKVLSVCGDIYGRREKFRIKIRAADAKEVGVGNPAEETCCYPNTGMLQSGNNLSTFERKIVRKNRFLPVI